MSSNRKTDLRAIGFTIALGAACVTAALLEPAQAFEPTPRAQGWLVKAYGDVAAPIAPKNLNDEVTALRRIAARRTAEDLDRFRWWSAGDPGHRWNEMLLEEMQDSFVVLPMAARHLALLHAAIDDAMMAARHHGGTSKERGSVAIDAALDPTRRKRLAAPSEFAAAAVAAARVLAHLFPTRADHFAARATQAKQSRLLAGTELPYAIDAGSAIGERVAELAIAHGKADGSDTKWTGTVPEGADKWKGVNPIAPAAAAWQTWVLATPSEFRPAPPPVIGSDAVKQALAELKDFPRTPKSNHRATYWEVHGGARAHTLWNEIARTKLLEYGYASPAASRVMAALNVALADAGIACWDAKFTYWYIRPPQLDPELKPLLAPPNHPSFPAAHGCFSTAAATVLARVFPRDAERLLALGKEAAEARIWSGIHYRFDIDAGQEIGHKVAEKTLVRAFAARTD